MNKLIFLCLLSFLPISKIAGQSISGIILEKEYSGTLDEILLNIGEDHNLNFIFDKEKIIKYKTSFYALYDDKLKLGDIFKVLSNSWDLIVSIDKDGQIYIAESKQAIKELKGEVKSKRLDVKPDKSDFTITGIIKDITNGERIPFATVYIENTQIGTMSNEDGQFTLLHVPSDTSTMIISYIGYKTKVIYLNPEIQISKMEINLSISAVELDEVIVIGQKENLLAKPFGTISTIKMSPKNLSILPNMGNKDVLRSLQLMPGISAANENSSGLYIRGGTPDQNLILYDGFTVYHVDHLYGFFSAFNSNAIKDVQLFKGGFEAKYGGRLSSVTEIISKDGNAQKFSAGGDISLLSMGAFAEIPINKNLSSMLAFRRSYRGPIYDKIFDQMQSESETINTGMPNRFATEAESYFYDLNAKLTYKPNDKDIYSFSFFNGTDNLDKSPKFDMPDFMQGTGRGFDLDISDLTRYGNIGSSIKWSRNWNSRLYSNTLFSFSNYYSERNRTTERVITEEDGTELSINEGVIEDNNLIDFSLKTNAEYKLTQNQNLEMGYFMTYYDIDYLYTQNDTNSIVDRNDNSILAGVYLQDKIQLFQNKMAITPGIRASYFSNTDKPYFEPRLAAYFKLSKKLTFNAATGMYYQFANRVVREDILSGSNDFWILSDGVSIPVSSAIHYTAGLNFDLPNYLFSIEAYYKDIKDITEYSMRYESSFRTIEYEENFYSGSGYAKGIEILAQKKFGKLNGWISYTLGEARSIYDHYGDSYFPSYQDVRHEFKTVALYKLGNFDLSATWIYATGRPYTAPEGAYKVTLLDGTEESYYTVGIKNGLRLPDYNRLDLAVSYKLDMFNNKDNGNISFSIFNVYNRKNIWYKEFQIVEDEILETDVNYLGITPNLSLTVKF